MALLKLNNMNHNYNRQQIGKRIISQHSESVDVHNKNIDQGFIKQNQVELEEIGIYSLDDPRMKEELDTLMSYTNQLLSAVEETGDLMTAIECYDNLVNEIKMKYAEDENKCEKEINKLEKQYKDFSSIYAYGFSLKMVYLSSEGTVKEKNFKSNLNKDQRQQIEEDVKSLIGHMMNNYKAHKSTDEIREMVQVEETHHITYSDINILNKEIFRKTQDAGYLQQQRSIYFDMDNQHKEELVSALLDTGVLTSGADELLRQMMHM